MHRAKPCNAVETFCYDHIIADAVMKPAHDVLDEFVQELPRGAKVLEVGCGGAQAAAELLRREPTGLDLADHQVKRAQALPGCHLGPGLGAGMEDGPLANPGTPG